MSKHSSILPRLRRVTTGLGKLLFLVTLAAYLVACSQSGVPTPEDLTTEAERTSRPPVSRTPQPRLTPTPTIDPIVSELNISTDDLSGIKIEFWHFLPEDQVEPLLQAFNQDNPWGISVTGKRFGNPNTLEEAISSETTATVMLGYPDRLLAWHADNLLADLTPYLTDPDWGLTEEDTADYLPIFWEQDTLGSLRLGIPARRNAHFLLYNQTWANELKYIRPPDTPERFQAQVCAANAAMKADQVVQNDGYGGWLVNTEPNTMLGWLEAFGATPLARGSTSTYRFQTSQTEQAFTFLKTLVDNTCAWTSNSVYPDEPFAQRLALFATASLVDLPFISQAMQEAQNRDDWTVIPFPGTDRNPNLPLYGQSLALLQDTPPRQLAGWLLIRYLTSAEAQAFWTRLDGQFPVRNSAYELLDDFRATHPQWAAAWELLMYGSNEPPTASWNEVQWALKDAGTQLFRSYFTADRIQATLQELDRTAAEIIRQTTE
jgi:multiple sugar transport system substrate-binding protein